MKMKKKLKNEKNQLNTNFVFNYFRHAHTRFSYILALIIALSTKLSWVSFVASEMKVLMINGRSLHANFFNE